ncbi:MAG TPA: serine acetyltransferase [Pseudomonadales bacterium]|nr:serine acetyltransferase [Pseudomonadales bacterium]
MTLVSVSATAGQPDSVFAVNPLAPDSAALDISSIVRGLRSVRDQWRHDHQRVREAGGREFPSRAALRDIVERLSGALFPMRLGPEDLQQESEDFYVGHTLDIALRNLREQILLELRYVNRHNDSEQAFEANALFEKQANLLLHTFAGSLPAIRALLDTDVEAAYHGDPAARSVDEVVLCYPGLTAVIHHRLAHKLYRLGLPLLARIVSELAHSATGIDIHPGAQIGHSFFIDHGTGVVIGETAVIGNRVRLYQAVTLGAKRFSVDENGSLEKGQPRHPILEDGVVIYAGATVLGRITIGAGSSIGGNVWLTRSVPPGSHVTQGNLVTQAQQEQQS